MAKGGECIKYTAIQLLRIKNSMHNSQTKLPNMFHFSAICHCKKTRRGSRAGIRVKNRKRNFKHFVPSVIFSNCQSLQNKLDLLRINCRALAEYRTCDILCFCETWLDDRISDSLIEIENFSCVRSDRTVNSGKIKGGGVIAYINKSFCQSIIICEKICLPDIELLILNLRPFFCQENSPTFS